jgi:hypothetical protein
MGPSASHSARRAPYGPHMVHVAPIWCIRLPCGAWEPHMAPFASQMVPSGSCTVQMAPIWPPYGACCTHVVSSTSHTRTWLRYGSQMAHAAPIQPILAPTWPLHGTRGSHMAPSTLHMAHMAPIWYRQLHTRHMALEYTICLLSGTTWLLYGIHGSPMVHMARCTVHTAPLRRTWLPYGAVRLLYCATWLPFATGSNGYFMAYTQNSCNYTL